MAGPNQAASQLHVARGLVAVEHLKAVEDHLNTPNDFRQEVRAVALADMPKAQPMALPSTWTAVDPCKEQELEAL